MTYDTSDFLELVMFLQTISWFQIVKAKYPYFPLSRYTEIPTYTYLILSWKFLLITQITHNCYHCLFDIAMKRALDIFFCLLLLNYNSKTSSLHHMITIILHYRTDAYIKYKYYNTQYCLHNTQPHFFIFKWHASIDLFIALSIKSYQ